MDEIKNVNEGQEGQGGRRRRRKKKRGGGQGNNPNPQQPTQQGQQGKPQQQSKPQQPTQQKQAQQPQQQNQQNQQKNKKQKNKNKPQQQQQPAQENRKDTYLYALDGNLYVNLTNKCSNGCDFCVRNERTSYYGHYLWLRNGDPTVEKVIAAAKGFDLTKYTEVVFCGFGEPTYKVAEMVALCDYFHEKGLSTRLNTNGQANLINKRDVTPELKGKLDMVNVSLNFSCAEKYQPVCRSQFGESAFSAVVEFAKLCKRNGVACRFSIVDCIGEDEVEACKRLADSVKIPLYVRKYITDSGEE